MKHKKLIYRLCSLFLLLTLCATQLWGEDTFYSQGFENNSTNSWAKNQTNDPSVNSTATYVRTGSYSISCASTTSSESGTLKLSSVIQFQKSEYHHAIAYVKTSQNASTEWKLNGSSGSSANTSTSSWTRVTQSYNYTSSSGKKNIEIALKTKSTTYYVDDIILYTSSYGSIDLTKPSQATSASATMSAISWANGSDSGTGATGIQKTLIFHRTDGTVGSNDLTLNDQGIYSLTSTEGPSVIGNWTLIDASIAADATSKSGTFTAGDEYAIVHRDLAYNYSTPTYVTVPAAPSTKYHVFICPKDVWGSEADNVYINYEKTDGTWTSGKQAMTLTGFTDAGKKIFGYEMDHDPNTTIKTLQFFNSSTGSAYGASNWDNSNDHVYHGYNNGHKWTDIPAPNNASAVYLVGSFNSWTNADPNYALTKVDANHWTGSFFLNGASSNYEFKVYAVDKLTGWGYQFSGNGFWFGSNTKVEKLWSNNNNDQIVPLGESGKFAIDVEYYGQYDNHGQLTVTRTNAYAISFAKGNNGATGTDPASYYVGKDKKTILPANPYTLAGADFAGWNDGTNTYAAGAEYTMGSSNKTLTAQWTYIDPGTVTVESSTNHYYPGDPMTLTVSTQNEDRDGTFTYQWYIKNQNDVAIDGATSKTYTVNSMAFANAGRYSCKVTNGTTNKTSGLYYIKMFHFILKDNAGQDISGKMFDFTKMTGQNKCSVVVAMDENTTYKFAITDGAYCGQYGNTGTMSAANSTNWQLYDVANTSISAGNTGDYIYTLDYSNWNAIKLTVTYPSSDQAEGKTIYFDNYTLNWSTPYYRIGTSSANTATLMTKVSGTANLYKVTTTATSFLAWHICNAVGDGSSSIYKTNVTGKEVTYSLSYVKSPVTATSITYAPSSSTPSQGQETGVNDNCYFYGNTTHDGMLTHTATIGSHDNGTIKFSYTDVNGTAHNNVETTTSGLAHTCILTITPAGATGYEVDEFFIDGVKKTLTDGKYTHILSADATISATFKAKTYTVTFDKEGGTGGSDNVQATYGQALTTITAPTKTGHDFGGYWDGDNGTGTQYINADGTSAKNWDKTTASPTLYAKWTAKTYTITYKDQGDVTFSGNHESGAPTQYTYGVGVELKSASKDGYTFGGWFLESDCSGTAVKTIGTDAHENKTLFAKWTAKTYQVTLSDIDGNGATANITVTYGQECPDAQIKALTISKTGYTWNGFKTEGGTKIIKYEEDKYKFESSVDGYTASALWKRDGGATFTAMWTALSVKSIAVKTAPTKTTYTAGENFDPTGLVITKTMSDNSTVDVAYSSESSNFSFNPSTSTALTTSNNKVTITYGGQSVDQTITVTGGGSSSGDITWVIAVGSSATDLSTTSKSTTINGISDISNLTKKDVNATGSGDGEKGSTCVFSSTTTEDASKYIYATFKVADGKKFTPSNVALKVSSKNEEKTFKIEFSDDQGSSICSNTTKVSASATPSVKNIAFSGDKSFYGTVTVKLFCYGGTGGFRMGTPQVISGTISGSTPTPTTYSITYNCDGATTGCPDPATVTGQTNLPNPLPTVAKTGYTFGGWFTNSEKTVAAVADAALTANTTLYAKWTENPAPTGCSTLVRIVASGGTNYTMTGSLATNDATASVNLDDNKKIGSSKYIYMTLKNNHYITEGDNFIVGTKKWSDIGTKALEIYVGKGTLDSLVKTIPTADSARVVEWTITGLKSDKYTSIGLKRSSNQNTWVDSIILCHPSDAPTLSSIAVKTAPTKTTYTAGEYFNPAGLEITKTMSDASTEDVTYSNETSSQFTFNPSTTTALTTSNNKVTITYGGKSCNQAITVNAAPTTYTVTYNGNNKTSGSVPTDATAYTSGATVTVLGNTGNLARNGYTFSGWNTNSSGTGTDRAVGSTFTISANTTLYAKWTAEQYTLTLDKNGASADGQATVNYNATSATITTAVTPADGKTIEGYYAEAACTTKVLKADGSFAASNVSDYITSGKWSKTTDCTLYAKSIDAPTPGDCVETDYKSESGITGTSFSTGSGGWFTDGTSPYVNYFKTSSSTGYATLIWSSALTLNEGTDNNGVITITYAHKTKGKGFKLKINDSEVAAYTTAAADQIYEVDYVIPTTTKSLRKIQAIGFDDSGLRLYHIKVCPAGAATCTDPGLAYSTTTVTKNDNDEVFTHPLTNPHSVAVTYTSSKSDVASVDAYGQVTIKEAGTTVIKASSSKQTISGTSYCADEASYTLTVNPTCTAPTITWNVTPTAIAVVSGTCSASVTTNYADGVTWSASPSGKVTFSSTTGATTTITATATGQVTITAKVLGAGGYCAEEKTVQATITIGGATGGHVITHDTPTNGTFDVLLNGEHTTSANKGQLIALTATPASGYTFDAWDVYKTGESSTKITVTNNTFIMPDYDVTVQATFKIKGGESGCYAWGYGEKVTTVPTTNNDVTVDNRLVLKNHGNGAKELSTVFSGSSKFTAISLHGREEFVEGNLGGAEITSVKFSINTSTTAKDRCFVAFCNTTEFKDDDTRYLIELDDEHHNAKYYNGLPATNGTRKDITITAPAGAKSFAITRNFQNFTTSHYSADYPESDTTGWMPSAYRYLYHLEVCGGASAAVAVAPIGIVRDTTITCGTSTAIKLTAYGSLENGNTWYWQTTETGTSTTHQGATFDVTRAGTYYVRSRCVNPSDANDVSWSVARSITVPASAWTALPEISDLCGSTSGAATINYTVGQAASKLYVEASNTSSVVWYSNTSASTTGGTKLCDGVLSGGKYYTANAVSTTAVSTQYYYCEIFNGTCAVTSPLVTVDVKAKVGYDKFSLVMKDQLADQSVAGKTSMAISSSLATISGGTAALENLSSAAGKAQIVNDHLYLASSDGLVVVNLNYPLAAGDKIVITNRIAGNDNQYALTATKERNTEIVTEDDEYTIPAGSPLIDIKTLYVWRSTTAITYIKTINVKCDAQPTCQGPTFTSISANHTTIGKGSSVTLTAAATAAASGALTYQWYTADGTSAGATGAQLTLSNMQSTTSYYCVATENGCATSVKSTGITINVTECATPTIEWATAPANLTVGEGYGEATVNTNRPAGVVYTWAAANSTSGAVELSGNGTGKVTIIPVAAGTVRITATVTGDGAVVCDGSASVYQDITINPALEKYTIGYDLDGGTAGTGAPTIANRNEWVEIPNPTKPGFDFAGWTVSSGLDVTNGYWNTTNSSTGQDKIEYPCKVCYNATGNVYIYNAGANGQSIQLTAKWYQECNASGTSIDTLFKYKCSVAGAVGTAISGGTLATGNTGKFATSTYTSCGYAYKMDNGPSGGNSSYWKITLANSQTLQTGDKINIKGYITSSPGATYKLGVYKALGGDALGLYQFKAKTTEETYTYVVDSDLNGENAFYIQRGAGSSVYASEVFITRGGSGASCHHVIYHASYSDATGVTNDDQSYGSSDKATIKQCGFTRAGFDFVGWSRTKASSTKEDAYDPGDEVTLSADLVLYAVWKSSTAAVPTVQWSDVPATVYPGMQFTFSVTTNSDDPNLSAASLTATANATLINKSISGKTITATCQIDAATNSNPVLTLTTAGTSTYRSSVSTQTPTLQTCAGSGYQTIFSYTAKTTETALGTYAANGGTATLSGKAMNGNDVLTVNEQNYIQMRAGSNWVFTLDGNATFQAGDEITFTFASNDSVDRRTGVDLYMSLFNTNVPYGETASITYILQSASDDVSERIIGTNQLMMERANQFMKFGSITVRRATIGQTSIQAPTLEFWDAVGDSVIPVGHTVNKKVDAIPFTIYAKSNSSGEITYASYDIGVAIVNPETGEVSKPIAGGQTVITATIAANGCYNAKTIYYALVVDSTDCGIIPHLDNPLPTDQTATLGETVSFTVVASNADTYQWYSCDDTEESNTEVIPGANSATYSFTATEVGKKFYFCKVSSSCRSVVKTEPRFAQINPLPYTITYTAGVQDGTTYTEATFTANKTTTKPNYIKSLSNYFFVNGAAIHGPANGTMSSTIDIPMSRTETNYTGFNFNVLESYYLTVDSIKLNVAAVGTTGIQVQAILSDNHDHAISSAIKTITEGVNQAVRLDFPNLDVQLVDQVTMKILAWYDDANAYIRIGETTGIDGKIHSLPEPTIYWTSVPKDGTAGKDMLIAAESNITISDITYTSSNTAVATISDVEDVDAKRLRYVAAGTSTISASIKGDGVSYFAKTVTISQPITVVAAAQNTYTVTCFTSDGSKIYATYTQKTQGEKLSFMEPVNQGYTFAGWYVKNGTEPLIEPGQTFAPTQDTSVYAHWNAITYNITYNLNGGTNYQGAPATYTIETPDIELGTPTREGFTFLGWYNNADFTGDVITTISTGNYGAINLFARWKEQSESSCIDYGTWLFENNMTVGQKPAHAVSTTATTFSAFAVDQINFSSQKITYESGTGEFGGWKINTKGATITFCVDNNCAVSIRVGQLKSAMSITYIDADGKSQTTNLTANTTNAFIVSGETTVTLTTAGSSTVVLKEITVTDPCYIEPAYTVKRQHFGPTETVDQTEIGSINLAGAGVTYTLKETINGEGYGLTASFDAENGKMYIAGTTSNTSGKTQTLNITYVFQNDCSTKRTFEVTIPVEIYAGNPKLAYIIDGEKDGGFTDYNQSHAEGTALFEKLKQNFDVYAVNCYATVDETEIYNYYKDYDILLMTDYPNTSTTKTINKKKYSYSNAVGCMVDKKPILTFETFVADLDNWHIDSNPKSPEGADATNQMTLLCNANDILKTADFNVGKKVTMATQLPSPSLQGFTPKEAPDFVFIATIPRYSSPDSTQLLITCCERQTNIKARMMVLGMQSNTYEVISDSGYMVVCGLLKYLLLDDNIPDCSLIFHGQTNTSWKTAANWEGNTIPSELSPVRIDAPCVVDITTAKAGTVKINQKLNDEEVQLQGSLTVNSDAALTVTKFVRTMTVEAPEPHATAVSDLHILSTATGNGALIFDNANGDTKATVNYYSISSGESNGNGGLQNAQWQWMTTPFNDVNDVINFYYGAWMRRYDNTTHKWIDMHNGCSMTPFGGYELTQYGATTYEMQGTLATTANQTIKLAPSYNLIGNSWTAPINIGAFETTDFENAEATIVMINTGKDEDGTGAVTIVDDAKTSDVRTAGTYVSIPIKVATEVEQFKVIPSMQSFQVRAKITGGSLTLNYDRLVRTSNVNIQPMRAPGRANNEESKNNGINERLRIYVQGERYGDYIYLFQHDGTTMDFDNGWDGRKYMASNYDIPVLMAQSGSDDWHISTQPQLAGTQIAFYQGEDNFYTIGFSYSGYETLWFYDKVTDQYTEINNENTYVFISNTTKLQKRFEIRDYNPNAIEVTTGTDKVESSESGVQKVILHEKLFILNQGHVYNAQGTQVK